MHTASRDGLLASQIVNLFRMDIQPQSLAKAEQAGRIPEAKRKLRGKIPFRYWDKEALPKIGELFGNIKKPKKTHVISTYVPKGGTGKTFWTYNFSRMLALHGIKVLVIGADFQCSISKSFGAQYDKEDELPLSLFDVIVGKVPITDVISGTDLPTLFYIPESTELTMLDRNLIQRNKREMILSTLIKPLKSSFDVILIDCPPQWNELVTNSLIASDMIISPINADGESYHSFKIFITELKNFMNEMDKDFSMIKFITNNVDVRTKYTTSFQKKFSNDYPDLFTSTFIRESVLIKESGTLSSSVIEYKSKSSAADDLYNTLHEVWNEVLEGEQ